MLWERVEGALCERAPVADDELGGEDESGESLKGEGDEVWELAADAGHELDIEGEEVPAGGAGEGELWGLVLCGSDELADADEVEELLEDGDDEDVLWMPGDSISVELDDEDEDEELLAVEDAASGLWEFGLLGGVGRGSGVACLEGLSARSLIRFWWRALRRAAVLLVWHMLTVLLWTRSWMALLRALSGAPSCGRVSR